MISPIQSPLEGMVSGTGEVQTPRAMRRALFVRVRREPGSLSAPASGRAAHVRALLLSLVLIWIGASALSETVWAGTLGPGGKDAQERTTTATTRRELAAIVIASARTAGTATPQETRGFTLAESGALREARDGETPDGAGAANAPGVGRLAHAFPQTVPGLGGAARGRANGQEEGYWPGVAFRELGRELPPLGFEHGPSGPPAVALSVFMGRKTGDVFSSLHEEYAWRMKFKSMTLGLGFYREIAVGERARILPYVGVIRSSLSLRPAGLASEQFLHEYQLTVLCFGLPLVIGF